MIYGVCMFRGYFELISNFKDNEVDYIRVICFNSDIVLMFELLIFRVLFWVERIARVICDIFIVIGEFLLIFLRYIVKI